MELRVSLEQHGKHLWTRELAKKIRRAAEDELEKTDKGDVLVLDLDGVEVFDYSFANELFGKLMLSVPGQFPGRFIVVENLTDYTHENLSRALEGLNLAMICRRGRKVELVGKFHPSDKETFQAVMARKEGASAGDLSKELGVNLTAMNERLTKLTSIGLLRREKSASAAGREQYAYCALR